MKNLMFYFNESEKKELPISYFKGIYEPKDLAIRIENHIQCNLISVDWESKTITCLASITDELKIKSRLKRSILKMPEYMKGDKIDINKPYI